MRNPFKPASPSKPEPTPERGRINQPRLCDCCETKRTTNGLCDDCANGACVTFGH
jgi:hypothetical protein